MRALSSKDTPGETTRAPARVSEGDTGDPVEAENTTPTHRRASALKDRGHKPQRNNATLKEKNQSKTFEEKLKPTSDRKHNSPPNSRSVLIERFVKNPTLDRRRVDRNREEEEEYQPKLKMEKRDDQDTPPATASSGTKLTSEQQDALDEVRLI